jgi:hypothetical protein
VSTGGDREADLEGVEQLRGLGAVRVTGAHLMKRAVLALFSLSLVLATGNIGANAQGRDADPPPPRDLPRFWTAGLEDVEREIRSVEKGSVETIAVSPGGRPVRAVVYGEADALRSQANYNSAVGAGNAAYYARKDATTKPAILLVGPVHGHEIEGIVGLVNLIHVAETGQDHRGRAWPRLAQLLASVRVVIVPCANPDGRARCPYDSFVGLPTRTMTKYGQGTRRDGSLWGWPGAKALHPMKGDVGILGAYFNDDGINLMHDDFFLPMAKETEAILRLARREAPDMAVSLHSHEQAPVVLQASYVPSFMKERIRDISARLKARHGQEGLPYGGVSAPQIDDQRPGPSSSFNLTSALHHVSGAMAFTFECSHGSVSEESPTPIVSHAQILDIQLILYEEMLRYALENRLLWSLPDTGR